MLFLLAAAFVSAQNSTIQLPSNLPQACSSKLKQVDYSPCGTAILNLITSGQLPQVNTADIPSFLSTQLNSFCTPGCSTILDSVSTILKSSDCSSSTINAFNAVNLSGSDLATVPKPIQDLVCIKDASNYCLISQLPTILTLVSGGTSSATLTDQNIICTRCSKLEVQSLAGNLASLAKPVQDLIGSTVTQVQNSQKTCPADTNNGAAGMMAGLFMISAAMLL